MKYRDEILANETKITKAGLLCLEYSQWYEKCLIKISNFGKYAEYIYYIWRQKSIASDWVGHVNCMAHGLKGSNSTGMMSWIFDENH